MFELTLDDGKRLNVIGDARVIVRWREFGKERKTTGISSNVASA